MELVVRSAWRARPPKATNAYLSSTKGVKVHYTGDTMDPRLLEDHKLCPGRVRQIQNGHMDGNGWNDIGYSAVVCPHGVVYEGRGLNKLPSANGPGLNSGHYAVCGLVGNKGLVKPPPAMLNGIRDAIEWFRRSGNAGNEIKGHRDGYATDCPGPALYSWVKVGAPRVGEGEDDMDPKTVVTLSSYWTDPTRNQFSHKSYPAGFLWTGAVAETRIYGKAIIAKLDAMQKVQEVQGDTIAKLADLLGTAQVMTPQQVEEFKATVRGAFTEVKDAIDGMEVTVNIEDEEEVE